MKSAFYIFLLALIVNNSSAQKNKHISVAFINTGTANPFSQFGKLITGVQHPGVELGYSFNWNTKTKHDWYQEIKLAYFYHRFVQHAVPLYTDFGYRYKFTNTVAMQAAIGAGYMHSIPATAQLKLQRNGEYKNSKGIGRMQGIAIVNIGGSYIFNASTAREFKVFITYQQMLQTPFINAYVPLLPYNSLSVGVSVPLKSKKQI